MKKKVSFLLVFALLVLSVATAFAVEDRFHLTYEQRLLPSDAQTVAGELLVTVVNNSDFAATDLVVSIPEANKVTYDSRAIFIGSLEVGGMKTVLNPWTLPVEMTTLEVIEREVVWRVEYTAPDGSRVETEVVGDAI